MLFAEYERIRYARPQLAEVICQLRFPTILPIQTSEPAAFQEAIRREFPRYAVRQEQLPPKVIPGPTPALEPQKPVANHTFLSADNAWKLNLTQNFIALSTLRYQRWEDFAAQLDKLLAQFIQIYQPAFFERLGLRYVNAFSRKALGLEEYLWDDLIQSHLLGILGEPDVMEQDVGKNALAVECALAAGCRMKLHAGPGRLGSPKGAPAQQEVRFFLDGDFSAAGNLDANVLPAKLEELHRYAVRVFRGAITPQLHSAMGPISPAEE